MLWSGCWLGPETETESYGEQLSKQDPRSGHSGQTLLSHQSPRPKEQTKGSGKNARVEGHLVDQERLKKPI